MKHKSDIYLQSSSIETVSINECNKAESEVNTTKYHKQSGNSINRQRRIGAFFDPDPHHIETNWSWLFEFPWLWLLFFPSKREKMKGYQNRSSSFLVLQRKIFCSMHFGKINNPRIVRCWSNDEHKNPLWRENIYVRQ